MSGGDPVLPAPIGLLSLSHVHPNVPDRRHVLDLVLDPAGSRTCQGHAGSHFIAHAAHTARQFAESSAARLLHQGNPSIHPSVSLLDPHIFLPDRAPYIFNCVYTLLSCLRSTHCVWNGGRGASHQSQQEYISLLFRPGVYRAE